MVNWNGGSVELGEQLPDAGPRRTWRATVGGRPALAIEADTGSDTDAAQIAERLRRLSHHPDDSLRPLLAWARDGRTVWVVTDPDSGQRLDQLLAQGPLSPREAAAVGWSVLTGLQVLHEAGLAHSSLGAADVQVDRSGRVRLGGHWFNPARRAGTDDLLADIQAAGALTCAALGIDLHAGPDAGPAAAEKAAPALTRTARAIAGGASGANVSGARMALAATAGSMVQVEGIARAGEMLAARVRGESVPEDRAPVPPPVVAPPPAGAIALRPLAPLPPPEPVRPAPGVPSQRYVATAEDFRQLRPGLDLTRYGVPVMVVGGILIGLFIVWLLFGAITRLGASHPSAAATSRPTARVTAPASARPPSAAASPTPAPAAPTPPTFGPASAGPIKSIDLTAASCAPNSQCGVEVTVHTTAAGGSTDVTWTVKAVDTCTGAVTDVATNKVTEQGGWTTVIGDNTVTVPAGRSMRLVAVTGSPATAASPLVPAGGSGC